MSKVFRFICSAVTCFARCDPRRVREGAGGGGRERVKGLQGDRVYGRMKGRRMGRKG